MITGRNPSAHGIYDFLRPNFLKNGGAFLKINNFRDNHCETIWSIANRAGLRATTLNFCGMAPPPEIDGYVVFGFVPWGHLRHGTHQKGFSDQIGAFDPARLQLDRRVPQQRASAAGDAAGLGRRHREHLADIGAAGQPFDAAYCASEFGVVGFPESLAKEVGRVGIRAQTLIPDAVNTPPWV